MQQVKDLVLPLPWHRFNPWPGNFRVLWVQPKKKKVGSNSAEYITLKKKKWEDSIQNVKRIIFLAAPTACGSSQARDKTHTTAPTYATTVAKLDH